VRVLFIGEGRHDIGDPDPNPYNPRPAHGTIPALSTRVCPTISDDSVALAWREIVRFNPNARKRGFEAKVPAALLVATRLNCSGTVVVADRDGDPSRGTSLQAGVARGRELFPQCPIAGGLAIESVEAWTLGVPESIADELGTTVAEVRKLYPPGVDVERLSESSGKEDHRPKRLLERIARLKHRTDSTEFRQAVAKRTDVAALEKACPQGFAPFAAELRLAFGT
jgi:hypothetical protein